MSNLNLGTWHDLVERLWRDIDPSALSPDFQDYWGARDEFSSYIATIPAGQPVPMYLDSPATTILAKVERIKSRIIAREPQSVFDLAEKAIVLRDEGFVHPSFESGPISGHDLAVLLVCVIEQAFPRPSN